MPASSFPDPVVLACFGLILFVYLRLAPARRWEVLFVPPPPSPFLCRFADSTGQLVVSPTHKAVRLVQLLIDMPRPRPGALIVTSIRVGKDGDELLFRPQDAIHFLLDTPTPFPLPRVVLSPTTPLVIEWEPGPWEPDQMLLGSLALFPFEPPTRLQRMRSWLYRTLPRPQWRPILDSIRNLLP